jgi:hypothetical protein
MGNFPILFIHGDSLRFHDWHFQDQF